MLPMHVVVELEASGGSPTVGGCNQSSFCSLTVPIGLNIDIMTYKIFLKVLKFTKMASIILSLSW